MTEGIGILAFTLPGIISQFSTRNIIANQAKGLQENIDICIYCYYDKYMGIEFDQMKRDIPLQQRGLDFAEAAEVFAGPVLTEQDDRSDYGESRFITLGVLNTRVVDLVWTPRGTFRRIISMRYANEREKNRYKKFLD